MTFPSCSTYRLPRVRGIGDFPFGEPEETQNYLRFFQIFIFA